MAGLTMTEATDSDELLYVILKISTDLNDTLTTIDEEISSGASIPDAFDLYADDMVTAITAASADLVEFESRKYLLETSYSEAVELFVEYLEEGYTFEDALELDEDLDYAT
jgi:hypothetical protein